MAEVYKFFKYAPKIGSEDKKYKIMLKKDDGTMQKVIPYINLVNNESLILADGNVLTVGGVDFFIYNHSQKNI